MHHSVVTKRAQSGEMAQWLGALAAPPEHHRFDSQYPHG